MVNLTIHDDDAAGFPEVAGASLRRAEAENSAIAIAAARMVATPHER